MGPAPAMKPPRARHPRRSLARIRDADARGAGPRHRRERSSITRGGYVAQGCVRRIRIHIRSAHGDRPHAERALGQSGISQAAAQQMAGALDAPNRRSRRRGRPQHCAFRRHAILFYRDGDLMLEQIRVGLRRVVGTTAGSIFPGFRCSRRLQGNAIGAECAALRRIGPASSTLSTGPVKRAPPFAVRLHGAMRAHARGRASRERQTSVGAKISRRCGLRADDLFILCRTPAYPGRPRRGREHRCGSSGRRSTSHTLGIGLAGKSPRSSWPAIVLAEPGEIGVALDFIPKRPNHRRRRLIPAYATRGVAPPARLPTR